MAADEGLEYTPDGWREGGRISNRSADAAEEARRYLRGVDASPARFGGADAYVNALNGNSDRQAGSAGRAAEDRDTMSAADHQVADLGEATDTAADSAIRTADTTGAAGRSAVSRGVAEGM
ncbi:hypothetical protein ACH4RA_21515 [Streptomyces smyrnaeus]|uniref:hypothetical protein n=1 Tax=Streptomyces TaxID=1883 RepID=UPI000C18FB10|nr:MULTISPECIES: hypothetical protein [unclassified Streptomyces]MBQ0862820.1 hypothetical protein [Streptomyces sp. RK75]MBQ1125034.1 hypothetical protein [Streptomyces sp. B15]